MRVLADKYELRDYQKECLIAIQNAGAGNHLSVMATGLGKTVTFTHIPLPDGKRMLIISHRQELVHQPQKYFSCPVGFELGSEHSHGEQIVSASVQSLIRRLDSFQPDDFYIIVWDEAHHAAAKSYRKIMNYFHPYQNIGFTATPNRGDHVRLDNVFEDVIFDRDIKFGIQNGYLSDIFCRRVDIGYNLQKVHTRSGDFCQEELSEAMDGTADGIAEVYKSYATGSTLVFTINVKEANEIAELIPNSVAVTAKTDRKERENIIQKFTAGQIPCLINCMVFTEGTDIPRVETVMIARPTKNDSLYAQMVGRGLRTFPGKDKLNLIDCVGALKSNELCTASSLLGIDLKNVPANKLKNIQGNLFDLPLKVKQAVNGPESWIMGTEIVDLWAKEQKFNLHNINWTQMSDDSLILSLSHYKKFSIPAQDAVGCVHFSGGQVVPMQAALDRALVQLQRDYGSQKKLWDRNCVQSWGSQPASEKQQHIIKKSFPEFDTEQLTKQQAAQIINHILYDNSQ
jgi:superfamily II DNA or RNA helicase